jgi:hypothetical protein
MTQPAASPLPPVAEFARRARPHVPAVAQTVSVHVARAIGQYADAAGHGRQLVEDAVAAALHEFLDLFDGMPHRDRAVGRQFRALGQRHAARHDDVSSLYAALLVAGTHLPSSLVDAGGPSVDDPAVLGRLSAASHRYLAHLTDEISTGFAVARRRFDHDLSRRRLAEQLLTGRAQERDTSDETTIRKLPAELVVLVVDAGEQAAPEPPEALSDALVLRRGNQVVALVEPADAIAAVETLSEGNDVRVGVSWPVEPAAVPAAYRWARRVITLARRGIVADQPVLDCAEHRTQIWLHAEPELRQRLCQDMLAPLLAETPNSREILSETLLAWLESRDSAPAIAARLGVHAQTVRYRWKRINELFGEDLHDPEFVVQITMLLKASVPLWKAGDQRDFERFQTEAVR